MVPSMSQKVITVSLAEEHWKRIRASLLSSAEDLAQADSPQARFYKHTHDLIKQAIPE